MTANLLGCVRKAARKLSHIRFQESCVYYFFDTGQRFRPVTDLVFLVSRHLRRGTRRLRDEEDRVVPEAAVAGYPVRDASFQDPD